jgi:formylglycine-generating enzyme required for sulfatase activity
LSVYYRPDIDTDWLYLTSGTPSSSTGWTYVSINPSSVGGQVLLETTHGGEHRIIGEVSATTFCPEVSPPEGDYTNSVGGNMIAISAGTFDMGCTAAHDATGYCGGEDYPVHSVTLTHDFYMGETEVTQGEYQAITGSNPSSFLGCGSDCPVEYVSWHEVAEYANALSVAEGLTECFDCSSGTCSTTNSPYTCDGYRLPTEAEWEYAARAGTDYVYAGSDTIDDVAWYNSNSGSSTHPVAQKHPNDWGLYDMSGNVWEWTWDWMDSEYYSGGAMTDPVGPGSGSNRVNRGGSWSSGGPENSRVSDRHGRGPDDRHYYLGFRLARTVP